MIIDSSQAPPETRVVIGSISERWILKRPLRIVIEIDDDGTYVVSDDEFGLYGEGASREEAVLDFRVSLIEYIELLEARAKDHKPTAVLFRSLGSIVTRA